MLDLEVLQAMADEVNSGPEWCRPSNIWTELIYRQSQLLAERGGVEHFKRSIDQWYATDFLALDSKIEILIQMLGNGRPSVASYSGQVPFSDAIVAEKFLIYLSLLWDLCKAIDGNGEIHLVSEPIFGNPIPVCVDGRLISVDMCISFIEYRTFRKHLEKNLDGSTF